MSMWAGMCQLITEAQKRDKRGVVSTETTERDAYCNVYSISAAAYYAASAAGIRPQAVIELRACAYRNESLVRFRGTVYAVERVERTPDNVRLTLVERVGNRG
ncbi:hypothetical protein [Olsenella sp. Marseille-P4559]|uniref:hypothetical protein n=1 Tax=Olsenella sp. Marseille-P4559 TaxID=2364795 RepID=UPI00103092D2|nr:hypothetical protein [Olsenella sp. Marseille-P4559]